MTSKESTVGGGPGAFPTTHWSVVYNLAHTDPEAYRKALSRLAHAYWKPIYWYFRVASGARHEDAKDFTQEFLAQFVERPFPGDLDPERGRFRSFLKALLRNFLSHERERRGTLKRGGKVRLESLDFNEEEHRQIPREILTPEEVFDLEWGRAILRASLEDLERSLLGEGKETYVNLFRAHELEAPQGSRPSYQELARRYRITEIEVGNILTNVRRRLREILSGRIRETVGDPADVEVEVQQILNLLARTAP